MKQHVPPIQVFNRFAKELRAELELHLPPPEGPYSLLHGMLRYHLGWLDQDFNPLPSESGKRLRPTLLLLTMEALGADWTRGLPAAASIELLHNFSLIHDDIEDASPQRRHKPTLWKVWGTAQAINAGDYLFALARHALLRLLQTGYSAEIVASATALLDDAVMRLCKGQHLDLWFETQRRVTLDEYLEMIGGKTASLMACCVEMAALLANKESARAACRDFGFNLGLAFQMQDDILGIWGEAALTGKPSESDILQRKKSLPIVLAMQQSNPQDAIWLEEVYWRPLGPEEFASVLELLDRYDIRRQAEDLAEAKLTLALECLRSLDVPTASADQLETLARYAVHREA